MLAPPDEFYPSNLRFTWVLFYLREPEGCEYPRAQRALWREFSDLAAVGLDHMIVNPLLDAGPEPRR